MTGPSLVVLLALSLSLAAGCAARFGRVAAMPDGWPATVTRQLALTSWSLSARMAVQTAAEGGSADVFWRQHGDAYTIQVNLPLGRGAMRIQGDSQSVTAKLASGETVAGRPDELMRRVFDAEVPLAAMRHWLRGVAADEAYHNAAWNEHGQLSRLEQAGWRVEINDYGTHGAYQLPRRFYLERMDDQEVNIRFIVRSWRVEA